MTYWKITCKGIPLYHSPRLLQVYVYDRVNKHMGRPLPVYWYHKQQQPQNNYTIIRYVNWLKLEPLHYMMNAHVDRKVNNIEDSHSQRQHTCNVPPFSSATTQLDIVHITSRMRRACLRQVSSGRQTFRESLRRQRTLFVHNILISDHFRPEIWRLARWLPNSYAMAYTSRLGGYLFKWRY